MKLKKRLSSLKELLINIIRNRGISVGTLISYKDFPHSNISNYKILSEQSNELFFAPPVFEYTENSSSFHTGNELTQYALEIRNAAVFGSSNIIKINKNILYDLPSLDKAKKYRYTDSKILRIYSNKVFFWKCKKTKLDKAIWMGGNYSWNYYHLLYEFAIKFQKLDKLNIPTDYPVLIDEVCFKVPQYNELINIVNKKNYTLIPAKAEYRYQIKDLIFISCPNFIPPNFRNDNLITADDMQFDFSALNTLRDSLLKHISDRKFPKRIFLSRKNASTRRTFNEPEIMDFFLPKLGFETVYPEQLSFTEQISLFHQAEYIAGGSGAAFTNLLFCTEGCKVIIFSKYNIPFSGFSSIGQVSKADIRYIIEKKIEQNDDVQLHEKFNVNLNSLEEKLKQWNWM